MKKFLSLICAVSVCLTSIPTTVYASRVTRHDSVADESTLMIATRKSEAAAFVAEVEAGGPNTPGLGLPEGDIFAGMPYKSLPFGDGGEVLKPKQSAAQVTPIFEKGSTVNLFDETDDIKEANGQLHLYHDKRFRMLAEREFQHIADLSSKLTEAERSQLRDLLSACFVTFKDIMDETEGDDEARRKRIRDAILLKTNHAITYFRKDHHAYKDIIKVASVDRGKDYRYTAGGIFETVARNAADVVDLSGDKTASVGWLQEMIDEVRSDRVELQTIFDHELWPRYRSELKKDDAYIRKERERIIDILMTTCHIEIKEGAYLMFPGLEDVFSHTRRNLTNKRVFDREGVPYAITLPERMLENLYLRDDGVHLLRRLMIRAATRFDRHDHETLEHDGELGFYIFELTGGHDELKVGEDEVFLRVERIFKRALQVTDDGVFRGGMSLAHLSFLDVCYSQLQAIVIDNWGMDDRVIIDLFWPVFIRKANELRSCGLEYHALTDLYQLLAVKEERVGRIDPLSGALLIPGFEKETRMGNQLTQGERAIFDSIAQFVKEACADMDDFRLLFMDKFEHRYKRSGLNDREVEAVMEKYVEKISGQTYVDVIAGQTFIEPLLDGSALSNAYARRGVKQKVDCDGKRYGVWIGEGLIRTLMMCKNGHELFRWIVLEEMQHADNRGGHGLLVKRGDYSRIVEHGVLFKGMTSGFTNMLKFFMKENPSFVEDLRELNEGSHPSVHIFSEVLDEFFGSGNDVDGILNSKSLSLSEKETRLSDLVRNRAFDYMNNSGWSHDLIKKCFNGVASGVITQVRMQVQFPAQYEYGSELSEALPYLAAA